MKKKLLSLIVLMLCALPSQADEIQRLKDAITSQLIADNPNTALVSRLAQQYFPDGVETDQCLMEVVAYALPSDGEVKEILASMTNDEMWEDIDYFCPARSAWVGREHAKRTLKIARCYSSKESKYYKNKKLRQTILKAIEYWCDGGFECTNWWYNCIGVPKEFAPILLLMEDEISPELMAKCIKVLDPAERENMTGQNKVWVSGVTFIKGLLLRDTSMLELTSEAIKEELRVSQDEGIQYDYSFHQHGAMQQFGNYGLAFASSQSYWMRVFSGTSYDFTSEQKQIMRGYMVNGIDVTVWRGYMDMSSCGRQLFENSQSGKAASLLISNLNMMDVDEQAIDHYQAYVTRNYYPQEGSELTGNFQFPISKYTVHRADDFMFSVKMFSKRIIGGEITNQENLKGYHLADGATMIYRTGREYENISSVWDGKYMPGTTVERDNLPLKRLAGDNTYLNGSDFVGGVSCGDFGVSALEYRRDGVSANKSWFFMEDVVLCLGNSIVAESGNGLVTTLNQCRYYGGSDFEMDQKQSATRVESDGVIYETLDSAPIDFIACEQVGDWHSVADFYPSEELRKDVFTAQIEHKAGDAGSYSYVVRPSTTSDEAKFRVIQNDAKATVVEMVDGSRVMIVFWSAGEVSTSSFGVVAASAPVMAIVSNEDGYDGSCNRSCEIYDPLACGAKVTFTTHK